MNDRVIIEIVGTITSYNFQWVQPQMGSTEIIIKSNDIDYIFKGNEDSISGVGEGDRVFARGALYRGKYGVKTIMKLAD